MLCPYCRADCSPQDNYCHNCGSTLGALRPLPVEEGRSALPAPSLPLVPVLARGAAYLALGVLGQWLLRALARAAVRQALRPLAPAIRRQPRRGELAGTEVLPPPVEVSEVVIVRRISWWRRRP
ncbi:hypothetical protein HRbin25_00597 [bacterium HR25]|nr:hypothetical protein HRbin25_00597 [bacterium HR25]